MSYGTSDGFDTYVETMGYVVPAGDVDEALARATVFIDAWYGYRFSQMGVKTGGRAQITAWPRTGAYDAEGTPLETDEEPIEVERATYEAALQELASPRSLQPVITSSRIIKKVSIEGAVSVEYANTDAYDMVPRLTIIDGLLAPLFPVGVADNSGGLFGTAYRV